MHAVPYYHVRSHYCSADRQCSSANFHSTEIYFCFMPLFFFVFLFFFGLFLYYILSFCCCCYVAQRQTGKMMENPRVADTEQIGRQRDVKGCKWTDRRQIVTRTKPHTFRPRHAQNTSVVRVSSQRGTH